MNELADDLLKTVQERLQIKGVDHINGLFSTLVACNDIYLCYNPKTDKTLPISLPIKGEGIISFGIENSGSFKPILHIDIITANTSGINEHNSGTVVFHSHEKKFTVSNFDDIKASTNTPINNDMFFKTLARFVSDDIDISLLTERTPEQDMVLNLLGIDE